MTSLDAIRRRLDKVEASKRIHLSGLGFYPAVRVITESNADRDRQLAALQAAGRYRPGQLVIDRRIVDPEDMRP